MDHAAVLLPDSRILVVGGTPGLRCSDTAEIFDPRTESWRKACDLSEPRCLPSATLLPNGKVLIAGGETVPESTSTTDSTEIFDFETETCVASGSLNHARGAHAAVLLPSGQVMVAGGGSRALEVYDPATEAWTEVGQLADDVDPGEPILATVLPTGEVLLVEASNDMFGSGDRTAYADLLDPSPTAEGRTLQITEIIDSNELPVEEIRYGEAFEIAGLGFGGGSEGSSSGTSSSPSNVPLVQMRGLEDGTLAWLTADDLPSFCPTPGACEDSLPISHLPPIFNPGWHYLTVFSGGVASQAQAVKLACDLTVEPIDVPALTPRIGETATFSVRSQGARRFQWQQRFGNSPWVDIPGATGPSYTTGSLLGPESGARYRVIVENDCQMEAIVTDSVQLLIEDGGPPTVGGISPSGGEFWLLSEDGEDSVEEIRWEMSDDIRVCHVRVALLVSTDGESFSEVPDPAGGLPVTFPAGTTAGQREGCVDAVSDTRTTYTLPRDLPAPEGSVYKIQVTVSDHSGAARTATSPRPFYIRRRSSEGKDTLILTHPSRMISLLGGTATAVDRVRELELAVAALATVEEVDGDVIDLGSPDYPLLHDLYAAWDAASAAARSAAPAARGAARLAEVVAANAVLFAEGGIHDVVRNQRKAFTGIRYLVLVGDDRMLPMARIADRTGDELPEKDYPAGDEITADGTGVGRAMAAGDKGFYLSDDPLTTAEKVRSADHLTGHDNLQEFAWIPDLSTGRLVETPEEIRQTINIFLSGGELDLSTADHKVMVSGYDFLRDSASSIARQWEVLGSGVNGQLLTPDWGAGSPDGRRARLTHNLCGGGDPYRILSFNGHATHYEVGVPGASRTDIQGLATSALLGSPCGAGGNSPLDLRGRVIYSVGCHSGLPVPGNNPASSDHELDLPQTMMSLGATAYVANTGYGWGTTAASGYGERLMEIFTQQLTSGGIVPVGDAVVCAKQLYRKEKARFNGIDEKTVMQWTLFGLPMFRIETGIGGTGAGSPATLCGNASRAPSQRARTQRYGAGEVREINTTRARGLTIRAESWNLIGGYEKFGAEEGPMGLDDPCTDPEGCYYTLNGFAASEADKPVFPATVIETRVANTSQHGVLWTGGVYREESDFKAAIAHLASNDDAVTLLLDPEGAPRIRRSRPTAVRSVPGGDPRDCRASDSELNTLVLTTAEAFKRDPTDAYLNVHRLYEEMSYEVYYFNDLAAPLANCDRQGPEFLSAGFGAHYHRLTDGVIEWSARVEDPAPDVSGVDPAGVFKVMVVWTDHRLDGNNVGSWQPLELRDDDGDGTWTASMPVPARRELLSYVLQAVDSRGNVGWLYPQAGPLPASGMDLEEPSIVDVDLRATAQEPIFSDGFESGDTSRW